MTFSINDIKSQLTYEGARPTLFSVQITNPVDSSADSKLPYLADGTSLPESSIGAIPISYFGRTIYVAGDRKYSAWTTSFYNDEDFLIKNAMENWSNKINGFQNNLRQINKYKSTAQVTQYAKDGTIIRVYQFNGIFPTTVSGIGLNWSDTDKIEQFQVAFAYDNWEIVGGNTGNAGGI